MALISLEDKPSGNNKITRFFTAVRDQGLISNGRFRPFRNNICTCKNRKFKQILYMYLRAKINLDIRLNQRLLSLQTVMAIVRSRHTSHSPPQHLQQHFQ